jgi:CubicO group peptidase (beta-lactamase class C family)
MPTDLLPSTRRALLHRLAVAQRVGRAPSLTAAVVRDGALAWSAVRGEVEGGADAAYRIGSLTKTFTAVLVLQLRDEGLLDLTDPVSRHLPEVGGDQTLLQLLCHAAGITAELPGAWWERVDGPAFAELADALTGAPLALPAGARFHYSNVGFALLGEVVARLRGTSWADALQTRLLDPLELSRTSLEPRPPHADGWAVHPHADVLLPEPVTDNRAMAPAGQLWSTAADLTRWAAFLNGDTGDVLDRGTLDEMRQPASVDDGTPWSTAWGLGLQLRQVDGRRLVGHGGSMPGFVAALWTDPTTGDGAVTLANATSGVAVGGLADDLLRVLHEQEPPLPPAWSPSPVAPALLELTGTWYWGTAAVTLAVEGPGLLCLTASGAGRSSRFRRTAEDAFVGLDSYYAGERLRVVRDGVGRPSHLDVATFVFTRRPYEPAGVVPGGVDDRGWR